MSAIALSVLNPREQEQEPALQNKQSLISLDSQLRLLRGVYLALGWFDMLASISTP